MNFDAEYTKYWQSAVAKSIDGTTIAGVNEVEAVLKVCGIDKYTRALDVGCSIGRMYEVLKIHAEEVYGVDPDDYAVEKARTYGYKEVRVGTAERTGFDEYSFDFVFCWAVFDVVSHGAGLSEMKRILRTKGLLLLTGKNATYCADDELGFKAEKNAFLKGFPNRFTRVDVLIGRLHEWSFRLRKLLRFRNRGDLGKMKIAVDDKEDGGHFYEYILVCEKTALEMPTVEHGGCIECRFSETASRMAQERGFSSPAEFFSALGID